MERINLWCRLVATVSVISSMFTLLIPESSIRKAFNTLMSIILVFSMIYPLNGSKDVILSFPDKYDGLETEDRQKELKDYSRTALIYAAQDETEKYIENLIGKCECEVVCEYVGDTVQVVRVSIEGEFDDAEIRDYYAEIKKICSEGSVIEFNGELYE